MSTRVQGQENRAGAGSRVATRRKRKRRSGTKTSERQKQPLRIMLDLMFCSLPWIQLFLAAEKASYWTGITSTINCKMHRRKRVLGNLETRKKKMVFSHPFLVVRRRTTGNWAVKRLAHCEHSRPIRHTVNSKPTLIITGQDFRSLKKGPYTEWLTSSLQIHAELYTVKFC